jgi:hypothetical protein
VNPSVSTFKRLSLLAATLLIGCQFLTPAKVKNCTVKAVSPKKVSFAADFRNDAAKTARTFHILVTTVGDSKSGGGSLVEYSFNGHFEPGQWHHGEVTKDVGADPFNLASHLATIVLCQVHAVEYDDGTHWEGPSQL